MDGLLLRIDYDFLLDLSKRGLTPLDIRINFRPRDMIGTGYRSTFKMFKDFSEFTSTYESVIKDRHYQCYAGAFPVIENLRIKNENLSFGNVYDWKNITNKRSLTKTILYDSARNKFYDSEVQRYLDLMNSKFDEYVSNTTKAIDIRLNSYMDPCYVDAGYVSPNSN